MSQVNFQKTNIDNNSFVYYLSMLNTTLGKIEYNDDDEYRICIGKIFCVPDSIVDDYSFEPSFDIIYQKTNGDPFFNSIYETAAGFLLSLDPQTGLCVLFSYDYAALFYAVLCAYLNDSPLDDLAKCKDALTKKLHSNSR